MRVLCRHGHYAFYPRNEKDISRFSSYYDEELVRERDFYTFPRLQNAPNYSLAGKLYQGTIAIRTFAGEPWEIMRENNYVYHIASGLLVPKAGITIIVDPPQIGYSFLAQSPLLQAGSFNSAGQRLLSFDGEFLQSNFQFRVSEFEYA